MDGRLLKNIIKWISRIITFVLAILLAFFVIYIVIHFNRDIGLFPSIEKERLISLWGDYSMCFGAVFSFISVILAYIIFRKQTQTSYISGFDATFFNLLQIQRELYREDKGPREKIQNMKKAIYILFDNNEESHDCDSATKRIKSLYSSATPSDTAFDIMHYFRHLYRIIMYVHRSKLKDSKKKEYIKIIQAQMPDEALFIMLFNVVNYGNEKYIQLLDNYHFFINLRSESNEFDELRKAIFKTPFRHKYNKK